MSTIKIQAKCDDRCITEVNGEVYADYAPSINALGGGGDYIDLEIDIETGKVIGWDSEEVKQWVEEKES